MTDDSHYRKCPPRLGCVFPSHDAPLYFVTAVTWQRKRLLDSDAVHGAFRERALMQSALGVGIGRYVLMPDHLHVFVCVGRNQTLGESIKHIKQSITKALHVTHPGLRIWQPGFFDHLMRSNESYAEKWNYVRNNPLRAGLVECVEDWPYQGEIIRIDRV